jgi:hypothetical protein
MSTFLENCTLESFPFFYDVFKRYLELIRALLLSNIVNMLHSVSIACISLSYVILASTSAEVASRGQVAKSGVTGLQDVFQVEKPLRANYEGAACQQVIVQHGFAASYGSPYVGMMIQAPISSTPNYFKG